MLQGLRLVPSALLHRLHDTCLESADLTFDRCPAKGFPCPVPVQGCTSLRRHLLTLLADLPSSLVMEDQGEVCPLSRRVMSPPVSKPFEAALLVDAGVGRDDLHGVEMGVDPFDDLLGS